MWLLSLFSQDAVGYFRRQAAGLDAKSGGGQADITVHVGPMLFRRRSISLSFHVDVGLEETVWSRSVPRFVSMNSIVTTVLMVRFISRGFVMWVREFAHWLGISQEHGRQTLTDSRSLHVLGHLFGSVSATKF